jgi:small subunit ribosomal protein S9
MTPIKKDAPKKPAAAKKPAAPKKKAVKVVMMADEKKADAKAEKAAVKIDVPTGTYFFAIGRRKSAVAQVRLYPHGKGAVTVNDKSLEDYIGVDEMRVAVRLPLKTVGMAETADVMVKAHGGGMRGQADAIKLGIARALLKISPDYRATLKPFGVLTRDPREKERKKYGLKKARKSPQWAKR